MEIDSSQNLRYLIMKLTADPAPFILLRRQDLTGKMPQLILQVMRLLQQQPGIAAGSYRGPSLRF